MKPKIHLSINKGGITALASLVLVLASVTASQATGIVCGGSNVGCESGASAGKGNCSLLGWLYRREHVASWACDGSGSSNYSCQDLWDDDNCCGTPNAQSCPTAMCPCPSPPVDPEG